MSEELKPCPFCGNPPRKHISEDCYFFILCDKCGCHVAKRSPDAAEKHWNTRPVEDAQAARIAELEAASLAWEKLDWKPVWFSEVEPFPCKVLAERFGASSPVNPLEPEDASDEKDRKERANWLKAIRREKMPSVTEAKVPNLGDMSKIEGKKYHGTVDLLVGGTPCQDVSVAGKRKGFAGERSGLAVSYIRLLETMRPRWFVWENVPGVLSSSGGEDFKAFIRSIDEIGYSCAWRVLDAQYVRVDGYPRAVPQRRRACVRCRTSWSRLAISRLGTF